MSKSHIERKMKKVPEPPFKVGGIYKHIMMLEEQGDGYGLTDFSTEDLIETNRLLAEHNYRKKLQKAIRAELSMRQAATVEPTEIMVRNRLWMIPLWNAVLSLFGKGTMDVDDSLTQKYLGEIKPEWGR